MDQEVAARPIPGTLLLELGVPDDYTFRNVTAQELPQEMKNWLLMTLIILWTCLSLILLFLENRLFRIYKCMLKRGVYALQGNLDFSGGLSDIFKQCGKLMYMSDKLITFHLFIYRFFKGLVGRPSTEVSGIAGESQICL